MKKSSKGLALIGLTTIVIGISGLFQATNKINKEIEIQEAKAYNHSTENALDNVFMQDNNLILPFIFDNASQAETLDIRAKFAKANLTIKSISNEPVGTGTQITVNENTETYNIVIYGDVNGDGKINLIDVQRIILHYLNPNTNALTGLNAIAANVNNKDNNDINLIDAQRIILFYLGNLNTGLVVEEPEASNPVEPEDTISNITITNPAKYIYTVGEEINLAGGKINITYASGKVETIDMEKYMISGYDKNVPGKQTVTVSYRVNDTINFTSSFEVLVNVLNKEITTIISSTNFTDGTCYQPVEFTLKSGENEEDININDLKLVIKDSNGKIINDEKIASIGKRNGANGVIIVSFVGKVADSYTIIPSVGKVTGTDIKIVIKEDKSINKITLDTNNFVQGTEAKVGIHFWHEYTAEDRKEIDGVDMSKVSVSASSESLIDVKFLNEDGYVITGAKSSNSIIKKVSITPQQSGELILSFSIGQEGTEGYVKTDIQIQVSEIKLVVDAGEDNTITLYQSKDNIEQQEESAYLEDDGYIYTLVPIYKIDGNGVFDDEIGEKVSRVKVKDIHELKEDTGNISFIDNVMFNLDGPSNDIMESIHVNAYDANELIIYNPNMADTTYANSDVFFIGIALEDWAEEQVINGNGYIVVTYSGQEITRFNIKVK
ncbi:MAG: hypothetical protein HFJ19_04825 [Clostridia bacterium]|nr:hypothetical protein [Clostridia bacterium]